MPNESSHPALLAALRDLAQAASERFQMDFCVHGTPEHYVALNELLDATTTRIEWLLQHPKARTIVLTTSQRAALEAFEQSAQAVFTSIDWHDQTLSNEGIVRSPDLQQLRGLAQRCLQEFGFNPTYQELLDF